ncbi:MAG: SDR family NAD(P)-dependent oxidoreductase [Burkholderiaceae bacterium]|jgi:NAD(P)-dependent dehydrogenase (short-subunit alcohol dehydrogenase family)|nr:SDR family NAD(P)-dependent oxidoreductase [Burkholderiaceae bacterium]
MTSTDPAGRVAFITGGASGIGLAVATLLQRSGMKLALMDLTEPTLQAAASQLGDGEVLTVTGDVTRPDECARAVDAAVQRFGGIDLCWANAGIGMLAPLRHVDASEWIQVVQVNVFGVLHTVQAALPQLIARRGQIAVSASVASLAHAPCMSAYAASKAAAEAMCDSWRIELAHHGVDVTCIHPLWVTTPMVERGRVSRAFARLRQSAGGPLGRETPLAVAAPLIAAGILERRRRVFVPGWARWLFALRSVLHTRPLERDQLAAAQDLEALYLDDVKSGVIPVAAAPAPPLA